MSTIDPAGPADPADLADQPTPQDEEVRAFWEVAKRRAKLANLPGYFGPSALESLSPPAGANAAATDSAAPHRARRRPAAAASMSERVCVFARETESGHAVPRPRHPNTRGPLREREPRVARFWARGGREAEPFARAAVERGARQNGRWAAAALPGRAGGPGR